MKNYCKDVTYYTDKNERYVIGASVQLRMKSC